jgi:predicted MFS family arabinose efflux permease
MIPLLVLTNIGAVPLWVWVICTTCFFVLISGRMIPGMALITSTAQPNLRGTFMSLNGTVQSVAMGFATTLAGFLITVDTSGKMQGYPLVGLVAVAANLVAIWFVAKLVVHDKPLKA